MAEYDWHDGEHEYEDGYGDDGQEVRCVLCAQAKREYHALPSLEAPEPGTSCPKCGSEIEVEGFCGVCAEPQKPMTFDEFLSYAVNSCVNGTSK